MSTYDTIIALQDTWLKKTPIQSDQLSDRDKIRVPKGKSYPVAKFTPDAASAHLKVELGYGAGTWYVFDGEGDRAHWKCSWKDNPTKPTHTIVATQDTWLKKQPIQSVQLASDDKKLVERGTVYPIEKYSYDPSNSHYYITLGYGAGNWYIFDTSGPGSHWDCSWEDKTEAKEVEPEAVTPKPSTAKRIITTPGKIPWSDPSVYISEYFRTLEVTLGDRNRIPRAGSAEERNILALARELDKLRKDWGSGLYITSWYRPPAVNRAVGGAIFSRHITGQGVDIKPANGNLQGLQNLCLRYWRGGVGKGMHRGFVHLDTRSGTPTWKAGRPTAVWNY